MSEINEEINTLVHADIDGVITAGERARLQGYLDSDAELRQYHSDCQRLAQATDSLEELEPPAGLAESILAMHAQRPEQREAESREGAGEGEGGLSGLVALWLEFPVLRYAAAFLLGALLTSTFSRGPSEEGTARLTALAGTMSPLTSFSLVESRRLESGSVKLDLLQSENLLQLYFEVGNQSPVELQISFGADAYELFGFSQQSPALAGLSTAEGKVTLQTHGGTDFSVFVLRTAVTDREIEVGLRRSGEIIETLRVSPGGTDPQ